MSAKSTHAGNGASNGEHAERGVKGAGGRFLLPDIYRDSENLHNGRVVLAYADAECLTVPPV